MTPPRNRARLNVFAMLVGTAATTGCIIVGRPLWMTLLNGLILLLNTALFIRNTRGEAQ